MMSEKEDGLYDSSNSSDDNNDNDDDDDCFYVVDMVTDEHGTCNISRLSDDPVTTANLTPSPVKGLSSSGRRRLRKEFSRLKRPIQAIRKNLNRRSHIPIVNSTIPEEDDNIGPMGGERSRLSMVVPGDRYYSSTLFSHHLQHQFDHHHHMHIFDPDDDEYNDKDEDESRNNESYHKSTNNSNLQAFRDSISKSWDEEENNNNDNDDDDDNIHHCSHHSNQQGCSIFDDDETTYTGKNSMGGDSSYQNSRSVATTTIASSLSSWFPSFSSFSSLSSRHSSSSFRGGEEELLLTIDGYVNDEDPMNNNDTTVVMVLYDRAVIVYDYLTKMRTVLFTMIFERWAFWLFGIYVSFFILFDIVRSSSSSSTTATSTDITELEILQTDSNAGDNDTTTSTFQLILTTMYASFIITSFGFVWGRSIVIYRKLISRRILEQQEHRQSYLQAEVLSAFCSPHRHQQQKRLFQGDNYFTDGSRQKQSISKEIIIKGGQTHNNNTGARRNRRRKRKNDQYYWSTSWWSHRLAHMWLVPVLVLALAFAMSQTSEWSMIQILYYVFITACTMGNDSIASKTHEPKIIFLILIPLVIALVVRWLICVANWVVVQSDCLTAASKLEVSPVGSIIGNGIRQQQEQSNNNNNTPSLTASYLRGILEAAQVEDGLLTRADFIEITLLAMQKIDLPLLVALREGYDQITKAGSVDLTRKKFTDSAANAINHPQHRWRMKKVEREQKRQLRDRTVEAREEVRSISTSSSSYLLMMDWLLGRGNVKSCDDDHISFLV